MKDYEVILNGEEWKSSSPPCSRDAIQELENNESVVTWLKPKNKPNLYTQHIPAILYNGKYWTISLRCVFRHQDRYSTDLYSCALLTRMFFFGRMSKSIYRHVRLRQGFQNTQVVHGIRTLRIPTLLYNEKQRTQARFKVHVL